MVCGRLIIPSIYSDEELFLRRTFQSLLEHRGQLDEGHLVGNQPLDLEIEFSKSDLLFSSHLVNILQTLLSPVLLHHQWYLGRVPGIDR